MTVFPLITTNSAQIYAKIDHTGSCQIATDPNFDYSWYVRSDDIDEMINFLNHLRTKLIKKREHPTAHLLQRNLSGFRGEAHLYHLSPGLEDGTEYVIVSAVKPAFVLTHSETMIFPATQDGEIISFSELTMIREYNHEACLNQLGYEVE